VDPRNPAGAAQGIPVTGSRLALRPLRPEEIDEQWQAMVGWTLAGTVSDYGRRWVMYQITRPEWEAGSPAG
jgi:hypothetical protein